jgi:hypothetical protein
MNNFTAITRLCLLTTSCSVTQKRLHEKQIRLIFDNELNLATDNKVSRYDCLGEVIGSQGHWYDYLFISNADLTQGALNDIYNKADKLGANVVTINDHIPFATSVTFYGQAYACEYDAR